MTPVPFITFVRDVLRVTLTPAQRVLARIAFDGFEPRDLEGDDRDLAFQLFGDVQEIPVQARAVLVAVCGARSGKTYVLGALYSLWRALTANLSALAPGELAVAVVVAPDLRLGRQCIRFALGAARTVPAIAALIESETADGFTLRRPDSGALVSIEALPATRGGSALRGRSLVSAVLDECAFFRDETFSVNDQEIFKAVAPRVLPGGLVVIASTPWIEAGLLYDEFSRNHGHPLTAMAVHAPTIIMNPSKRPEVERETERNVENAENEFGAKFKSRGTNCFFDPLAIAACVDKKRHAVEVAGRDAARVMCIDVAFVRNSSAAAVVCEPEPGSGNFSLAELVELKPGAEPLRPSAVCSAFVALARRHGIAYALADSHYSEAVREHFHRCRMGVDLLPGGADGKEQVYLAAKTVIAETRLSLPDDKRLIAQLREVVARPKPGGGLQISSPQARSGEHGDLVSAVTGATWALEHIRLHPPRVRDDRVLAAAFRGELIFD
jgi:hypothetical protein